ncbi:MAG: tetratricopeptide repeat protein [Gemmatimonadota bacterium]|jgi:tetratricopeptide (TPR) repeat protein
MINSPARSDGRRLRPLRLLARATRAAATAVVLWGATGFGPPSLWAQDEIFQQGNQLYQSGDYAAAVEAYEAILASGFESHELHYNLGNAYFKVGDLGRAILSWERALELEPGDVDTLANLELANRITVDEIEPLPRFWLLSVLSWWVDLLPRSLLIVGVGGGWMALAAGIVTRILGRTDARRRGATWVASAGALVVLLLGTNLFVRELEIGRPERAVILVEAVPVRSAPTEDDNLTLFEVHEGTRVRVDQRTGQWAEVVLADGKVGWVPEDAMEII